ncbi:MAG TPA: YqgE/AlgH family protein [Vicinamibacterales bacterium]|nr:YqgE/AlgH family protein [Vicinamibacterales bacterium]
MANESLAPVLLVSMPQMLDPNFSKTVVLLAEYTAQGAFGLVLNRRMDEPARSIVTADEPLDIHPKMHLYTGGPVEATRAWILTSRAELDAEALEVATGVYLSASPTLVRKTLESAPDARVRMIVGYAGWGAGQLDVELAQGSWLMAPVQPDLIFETSSEEMWATAIRRMGAEPSMLHGSSGVH